MRDTGRDTGKIYRSLHGLFGVTKIRALAGIVFLCTVAASWNTEFFDPQDQLPAHTSGDMNFTQYPVGSTEFVENAASHTVLSPPWPYNEPAYQDRADSGAIFGDLPSYSASQHAPQPIPPPVLQPVACAPPAFTDVDIIHILTDFVTAASSELLLFFENTHSTQSGAAGQYFPPPSSALLREDVRAILGADPEKLQGSNIRSIICFALCCAAPVPLSVEDLIRFVQSLTVEEAGVMLAVAILCRQKTGAFYLLACVLPQVPASTNAIVKHAMKIITAVMSIKTTVHSYETFVQTRSDGATNLTSSSPSLQAMASRLFFGFFKAFPSLKKRTPIKAFVRQHLQTAYLPPGTVQIALPSIATDWHRFAPFMPVERLWWYLAELNILLNGMQLNRISCPAIDPSKCKEYLVMFPRDLWQDVSVHCLSLIMAHVQNIASLISKGISVEYTPIEETPLVIDNITCLAKCTPLYAAQETMQALLSNITHPLYDVCPVGMHNAYKRYLGPFVTAILDILRQELIAQYAKDKEYAHAVAINLLTATAWYCGTDEVCKLLCNLNIETRALLGPYDMQRILILLDIRSRNVSKAGIIDAGPRVLAEQCSPEQFAMASDFVHGQLSAANVAPGFSFLVAVAYMNYGDALVSIMQRHPLLFEKETLSLIMQYLVASDQHPSYVALFFANTLINMHRTAGVLNTLKEMQPPPKSTSLKNIPLDALNITDNWDTLDLLFARGVQSISWILNKCAAENTGGDVQALMAWWEQEDSGSHAPVTSHSTEQALSGTTFTIASCAELSAPANVKYLLEATADIWLCLLLYLTKMTKAADDYKLSSEYTNVLFSELPPPLQYAALFHLTEHSLLKKFIVHRIRTLSGFYKTLPPIWKVLKALRQAESSTYFAYEKSTKFHLWLSACLKDICELAAFLLSINNLAAEYNCSSDNPTYYPAIREGVQLLDNLMSLCSNPDLAKFWVYFVQVWTLSPIGKYYFTRNHHVMSSYLSQIETLLSEKQISREKYESLKASLLSISTLSASQDEPASDSATLHHAPLLCRKRLKTLAINKHSSKRPALDLTSEHYSGADN